MKYLITDKLNGIKPRKKVNPQKPKKNILTKGGKAPKSLGNNCNKKFIEDKETFKQLFKKAGKHVPKFFITLSNNLHDVDKRDLVFDYAHMFLKEGYTIEKIKIEIRKTKPPRRIAKPGSMPKGRIVKKR